MNGLCVFTLLSLDWLQTEQSLGKLATRNILDRMVMRLFANKELSIHMHRTKLN